MESRGEGSAGRGVYSRGGMGPLEGVWVAESCACLRVVTDVKVSGQSYKVSSALSKGSRFFQIWILFPAAELQFWYGSQHVLLCFE